MLEWARTAEELYGLEDVVERGDVRDGRHAQLGVERRQPELL